MRIGSSTSQTENLVGQIQAGAMFLWRMATSIIVLLVGYIVAKEIGEMAESPDTIGNGLGPAVAMFAVVAYALLTAGGLMWWAFAKVGEVRRPRG